MNDERMLLELIASALLWWDDQQQRLPIDDSGELCFTEPNFVKFAKKFAGIIERKEEVKAKMNFNCIECPAVGKKIREGDALYMNADGEVLAPKKFPPNIEIDFVISVKGCSACGENHESMIFELLDNTFRDWTHRSVCPKTGTSLFLSFNDYDGTHTDPKFANVTTAKGTHVEKEG